MNKRKKGFQCVSAPLFCGLFLILSLTSCASMAPSLKKYDDPSDVCNTFRQPLIETETDLRAWTFGGAAAGAAAGGVIAALLGGNVSQIAGGAAAGAAVGGAAGYLAARKKQSGTQAELLAAIDNDASSDSKKVQQVKTAMQRLWECRQRQIENIRVQFQAGEISKAQALTMANDIQTATDKDNQLIEKVIGRIDKRYGTYVDAKKEVLDREGRQTEVDETKKPAETPPKTDGIDKTVAGYDLIPAAGEFKIKTAANIRNGPSTKSPKVTVLNAGQKIRVTERTKDGKWYGFTYNQKPAFIYSRLVESAGITMAGQPTTGDPLENLASEAQETKAIQKKQKEQTERDLEELNILLS